MQNSNVHKKSSNTNSYQIGLIGCGAIAECFYLPALMKNDAIAEKLVLVDRDEKRAKSLAQKFKAADYSADYHDLLSTLDGAIVAVPNRLHYPIVMDLLQAGIHVLCEKPLAESIAEGRKLVQQAEKSNVVLAVNQTRRLFPSYLKIKEIISRGDLGELHSFRYIEGWKFSWPSASGFYVNSKMHAKGILMDIGAHVADLICWWLCAQPEIISSENDSFGGAESVALIKFRHNLCLGEIKLSRLSKLSNSFRLVGEDGTIEGGIEEWSAITVKSKSGRARKMVLESHERNFNDFGNQVVDNFISVVANGSKPLVPASEVLNSLNWLEECYRTATRLKMPWYEDLQVTHEYT